MHKPRVVMTAGCLALALTGCAVSEIKPPPASTSRAAQGLPLIRARIRVGFNPIGVAITPDGAYVYVANSTSASVSKIETATQRVVSTIQLAANPAWIALAPKRGLALVTSRDTQTLILLDLAGNYQVATLDLPYMPEQVVVDGTETLAYISNPGAPFITVVDLAARRVRQNIAMTDGTAGLALTPDQKFLYVSTRSKEFNLQVVSTADQSMVARTNAGSAPGAIAMDPGGVYAYVANHDSNDLTLVHVPTHHAVLAISLGQSPMDLKVAPGGRYVYVTGDQNTLLVLDTANHQVVDRLELEVSPWGLALSPDGRTAYAANYQLGSRPSYDASRPDMTLGSGAAQRVNNNALLVIDTGKLR